MRKWFHCALALAVALAVLMVPTVGFAAGQDMVTLKISKPSLNMSGVSIDVDADATISAGMDSEQGRGLLTVSVDGAGKNALTALFALEDEKVKGYMQGESGGLPYLLEAPLSEVQSMLTAYMPASPIDTNQVLDLVKSYQAFTAKMEDPAYAAEFSGKIGAVVTDYIKLDEATEEQIEIFGENVQATKITAKFTLQQALEMTSKFADADADLKALIDQYFALLGAASGETITLDNMLDEMKKQGVDADYEITVWSAGTEYVRMNETVTMTVEKKPVTMEFQFDIMSTDKDNKMVMTADINMPDEKPVAFTMDFSSATDDAGVTNSTFDISAKQDGVELFGIKAEGSSSDAGGVKSKSVKATITTPETDGNVTLSFSTENAAATASANGTDKVALGFSGTDNGQDVSLNLSYEGENYQSDNNTVYDGAVTAGMLYEGQQIDVKFGATLTLGTMPTGDLLTANGISTLDPFTATADQQAELQESVMGLLQNAAGVMMQVPGIAMMFGDAMAQG